MHQSPNNKVGRPRRDDLTKLIKCNVDKKTSEALEEIAARQSKSKAEILRDIMPIDKG